jgi:hypothetical protein
MTPPQPEDEKPPHPGIDRVALVLAIGMVVNLLVIALMVFYAAVFQTLEAPGIIAATQVLTGWGGGIVGILGGYVGYRASRKIEKNKEEREP